MNIADKIKSIKNFNLDFVYERMISEGKIDKNEIPKTEVEFKKFLQLILLEDGPVAVIDKRVDELWHSFILFTPQYKRFCDNTMGFFVHHQPRTSKTPVPREAISNFILGYKKHFGELNLLWWCQTLDSNIADEIIAGKIPIELNFEWSGWTGKNIF